MSARGVGAAFPWLIVLILAVANIFQGVTASSYRATITEQSAAMTELDRADERLKRSDAQVKADMAEMASQLDLLMQANHKLQVAADAAVLSMDSDNRRLIVAIEQYKGQCERAITAWRAASAKWQSVAESGRAP